MFGLAFIIVGFVLLLQAAGVFAAVPTGVLWGIVFIMIGIAIAVRHSMRRARREEWMAKRREAKRDSGG